MNNTIETQIVHAEERLKQAMLDSNVSVLNELLAPELIFTNHFGQILKKQDDLAAHQSGVLKVKELESSEQHIQLHGEIAIVTVKVYLSGTYDGQPSNGHFRFTRIWAISPVGAWHVIAAHACAVA